MSSGKRRLWILGKQQGQDLVKELAKPLVARLAPEELEDFDELAEAYFMDPRLESDEMLADGLGLLPDLVVALSLVAMTLDRLLSSVPAGSAESRLERLIKVLRPGSADSASAATGPALKDVEQSLAAAMGELSSLKEKYQGMQEELADLLRSRLLGEVSFLFLGANPDGATQLHIARELHQVEAAIREAPLGSQILLRSDLAVGADDLQRAFLAYGPQLIHFSGHGNRANALIIEGPGGIAKEISPDSLSLLFRVFASKGRMRCVVLNACFSETQAKAIAEYADAVIGMSVQISDGAAISFARAFYRGLAYGESVQGAFDLGRSQISLDGFRMEVEIPRLIALHAQPREIVILKAPAE